LCVGTGEVHISYTAVDRDEPMSMYKISIIYLKDGNNIEMVAKDLATMWEIIIVAIAIIV